MLHEPAGPRRWPPGSRPCRVLNIEPVAHEGIAKGFDARVVPPSCSPRTRTASGSWWWATTRTSRRWSPTSRVAGWTSRRAASRRSRSRAHGRAARPPAPARARVARAQRCSPERRGGHRQRDLRAAQQRVREHVLARVVRRAPARPEAVDRHRDRLRDVARVARAAAPGRPPPVARARRSRAAAGRRCFPASMRRPQPRERRLEPHALDLARDGVEHARIAASSSARRSQNSAPRPGTTLNAVAGVEHRGDGGEPAGPAGSWQAATAWAAAASASSALRPRSGAEPECAARPCAWTSIVPAALRRTTTPSAPSGVSSPASKHRHASQPAKRAPWAKAPCATPRRRRGGARPPRSPRAARPARAARRARARRRPSCRRRPSRGACRRRAERLVVGVADHRVDVAEQQDAARARCRSGAAAGRARGRVRSRAAAPRRPRRVRAPRRSRRTPPRRARRPTARRRRPAPRARAGKVAGLQRKEGRGRLGPAREPPSLRPYDPRTPLARAPPSSIPLDHTVCPSCPRWRSWRGACTRRCPASRRVGARARDQRAQDVRPAAARARGPHVHRRVARRGKLLLLELGELVVLVHLMSAGRMQLQPKRGSLATRPSRLMIRLPDDRELRVREFGSKQAMWLKVLRAEAWTPTTRSTLGPGGVARPAAAARSCSTRRGRCTRCCATSR